jgi:hypothetical protein
MLGGDKGRGQARAHRIQLKYPWPEHLLSNRIRACHPLVWEMRSSQHAWCGRFGLNPPGTGRRRRMPVLQLLAVALLRRVAAPWPATPTARSHSQTN